MRSSMVPFRLDPSKRESQLRQFNARTEIDWFGFEGSFQAPGSALIRFAQLRDGASGGGGTKAINGGVISAGFDAAFVLAGLGHYETEVVVTLELSVKFLSLATASPSLVFEGWVIRSARHFAFAEGSLRDSAQADGRHFAMATAMVAPAGAPDPARA